MKILDRNKKEIHLFDIVKYYERTYLCVGFEPGLYSVSKPRSSAEQQHSQGVVLLLLKNSPEHKYPGERSICPPARLVRVISRDGLNFALTHSDSYLRRMAKELYEKTQTTE